MLTTRRHAGIAGLAAVLLAIGGCCAFSPVSAPERPLRLAVYVGDGARGIGVFRWLELTALAKDAETVPVDADAIRGGALDGVDTLIVPGGSSVTMAKTLGAAGRDRIKEFVARGGGYIGTCAGCCLVMAPNKARPVMLGFVPYTFGAAGGGQDRAELNIHFNERAEALAGIKKGNMRIKFSRGPVPVPARTATNDAIEVVATYAGDINAQTDKQRPSKAGQAAALAGTYGKGRVFVFAVHPEMDVDDHSALRGAFRYVTGREVTWTYPQRRRGQLTVGCRCGNKFGIASARFIQRLVRAAEFDVVPVSAATLAEGARRHLDTVIDPATFTDDGTAALASLRRLAAEPAPAPAPFPKKVAKPLRAAIYNDTGGSCFPVAALLALAPEYELTILDAADYRAGALANVDLLVQPGGGCRAQYEHLGPTGVEALRRYVTGGGRYYGICAGAFLASQPYDATKFSRCRVGLVPFRDDEPAHYRGWAPIKVDFTDEGREALGASLTNRTVMYWGGPALIPGKPDADTDVKVFGRYGGRLINTCSPKPVADMLGKAAFVGGRVGKGKVFVSCPQPEKSEANFDIVRGGIRFLTGVAPSEVDTTRTRDALSVFFRVAKDKKSAEFYFGTLLRDRRFDVRAASSIDANDIPHLDAIVIPAPEKDDNSPRLRQFVANGGRIVVVADTDAKRALAEKITGAVVVDSYAKVVNALLANSHSSSTAGSSVSW